MSVTLARATVSKVCYCAESVLTALERIRSSDCLWHLRGNGARNCYKIKLFGSVVLLNKCVLKYERLGRVEIGNYNRHLTAFTRSLNVAEYLMSRVLNAESSPQYYTWLSVLGYMKTRKFKSIINSNC